MRQNGYCVVRFNIADDGTVADAGVVLAVPAGYFENASLAAVRKFRFELPASAPGVRMRRQNQIAFRYTMMGSAPPALQRGEWVRIAYSLASDGTTKDIRITGQSGPDIKTSSALRMVGLAHFQPVLEGGVAVDKPDRLITIYGPGEDEMP